MFLLILCFCLISTATVQAQDPVNVEYVNQFAYVMQGAKGLDIDGDKAYMWGSSIYVLDIADLTKPTPDFIIPLELGSIWQHEVDAQAGLAYAATQEGFHILDIEPPGAGDIIGEILHDGRYFHFDRVDENIYLVEMNTFSIIDVSDPENPVITGSCQLDFGKGFSVTVLGDYAYVVEDDNNARHDRGRLVVIDVSNPENTRIIARREHDNMETGIVEKAGNHLCILARDNLLMYNVDNPRDPQLVSEFEIAGQEMEVDEQNELIFACVRYDQDIQIIDYSNPEQVQVIDTINLISGDYPMFDMIGTDFVDGILYLQTLAMDLTFQPRDRDLADTFGSLEIFNVEDPARISILGRYQPRNPQILNFYDNFAYVNQFEFLPGSAVSIWDVSNPDTVEYLRMFSYLDYRTAAQVFEDYLVMFGDSIYVYDISQPDTLVELGSVYPDSIYWVSNSLKITDGIAIICGRYEIDQQSFVKAFDIIDPGNITELWCMDDISCREVYPMGNLLVCLEGGIENLKNLCLYDVSDPENIIPLDTLFLSNSVRNGTENGGNGLCFGNDSLYFVELQDQELVLTSVVDCVDDIEDIQIVDDLLYLLSRWQDGGLFVYDISDLDAIQEVGSFIRNDFHQGLWVHDDNIYVAEDAAVNIYHFENPDAVDFNAASPERFALLSAYPNPFNSSTTLSFTLHNRTQAALNIYNSRGQLVDVLLDQVMPAGTHQIVFDGLNLASGVYLAKLVAGGREINGSETEIVLIR